MKRYGEQPLTAAEKQTIIERAGPHRNVEFVFKRYKGKLRAVRARIISNYEAKKLGV